jgi:hypothetical protein
MAIVDDPITVRRVAELPEARRGRVNWQAVVAEAIAYPNEWAVSPVSLNPSIATQMRKGKYAVIDPTQFDIRTRRDPADYSKSFIYLRVKR